MSKKILVIFGTRPEAIKMALLVKKLKNNKNFDCDLCVTGQHREMLDQVLNLFDLEPDYDMDIMEHGQDLYDVTSKVLLGLREILKTQSYDLVLVHGDTTTSMVGALAAYYERIPVGHVEAGLRTYDKYSPWLEEINRQITGRIASIHFVPTEKSKENLIHENVSKENIFTTGNTVIDSLQWVINKIKNNETLFKEISQVFMNNGISKALLKSWGDGKRKIVLITGHRRENFGEGFDNICSAIKYLSSQFPNVDFVYPVHLNPNVRNSVQENFGENFLEQDKSNIYFIEPLEYLPFVQLLQLSTIVLTDSGGIQEEAPGLSKPVLVMRDTTERPEAVDAGTVKLVGANSEKIINNVTKLLTDQELYQSMCKASNPYGDGTATDKIIKVLQNY